MEKVIKQNLRILCEKYEFQLVYECDDLFLKKANEVIKIRNGRKDNLVVTYEVVDGKNELEIAYAFIFDILISIFERDHKEKISPNHDLITLDEFYNIEGEKAFWEKAFDEAKFDEVSNGISYKNLGGNRILVEYYRGRLFLRDDLTGYASNVIKWK